MQSVFVYVLWIVCGLGIVIALAAIMGGAKTWEGYGKHRLVSDSELDHGSGRSSGPAPGAESTAERDAEIRQLLEARNLRRARRGEPPIDIEAELSRLVAPTIDEGLRAEIRELVVARNYRRLRQGREPLDIDAEVEREIAGLSE